MNNLNELGSYIKDRRREKGLSLRELEELTGISRTYLSILERGVDNRSGSPVQPTLAILKKLAAGLDVPLQELIYSNDSADDIPPGAMPFRAEEIRMIPVKGKVSAGRPGPGQVLADAHWPIDVRLLRNYCTEEEINKSFYLSVSGKSMEPHIYEGDLVLIVPQTVEDGDVALVELDGKNTCLKVVSHMGDENTVLSSADPSYMPMALTRDEYEIQGKALLSIGMIATRFKKIKCR